MKEFERNFGKMKLKVGVVDGTNRSREIVKKEMRSAVALLQLHEVTVYALFDAGATPNTIPSQLVNRLRLKTDETSELMTVANGAKLAVLGKVQHAPTLFDNHHALLTLFELKNIPIDLATGRQIL